MERQRKTQKPPKKVVNTDKNKKSAKKSRLKSSSECSKGGFYYSFLTVILLLCLVQITISAVLNISKIISYKAKIIQITNTKNAAQALNDQLHDSINNFSNVAGLEAIARNNLKMSSDDEVMVIINTPKTDTTKEKTKKNSIFGD